MALIRQISGMSETERQTVCNNNLAEIERHFAKTERDIAELRRELVLANRRARHG